MGHASGLYREHWSCKCAIQPAYVSLSTEWSTPLGAHTKRMASWVRMYLGDLGLWGIFLCLHATHTRDVGFKFSKFGQEHELQCVRVHVLQRYKTRLYRMIYQTDVSLPWHIFGLLYETFLSEVFNNQKVYVCVGVSLVLTGICLLLFVFYFMCVRWKVCRILSGHIPICSSSSFSQHQYTMHNIIKLRVL